jgi:EmrB/QacA subfamily drug resistance transporter
VISSLARSPRYKWYAFGTLAVGTFASVVDHGSVSVALPTIATRFQTDIPSVQWLVIGYAMTVIALLLPMGRLADLITSKRVYIIGSFVVIAGSVAAGTSSDLSVLIASRIVQGTGAAMTQGTGMAIMIGAFPPNERGKAIGLIMTMVGTGAVAGPALGGFLVDAFGWRSVFFATVPMVAISIAMCVAVLSSADQPRPVRGPGRGGFDWLGAFLSSSALLALLLGITNAHRTGWSSPPILGAVAAFVVLIGGFIWWELRIANPMLNLRLFRRRNFFLGVTANYLMFIGSSAILFMTPFYLQNVLGYSPSVAGLCVVPGALCMAILGPLSGRLSDRYGWRKFTVTGLMLSATGIAILSQVTAESSLFQVIPGLMLTSSGMGIFYSPNSSSILSAVERESHGVISALVNLIRNAGNVVSVAVATAIVTATMGSMGYEPSLDAVRHSTDSGVAAAFTTGMRYAFFTMIGSLSVALFLSALPTHREAQADPVPVSREPVLRPVTSQGQED